MNSEKATTPTTATGTRLPDYVLIAEVDRVRGLAGEVVVTVHADDPSRMAELSSVFMELPAGGYRELAVEGVKRLRDRAVVKLAGYESVEEARSLVGARLFIPLEASTPPPEGRYYAYQLQGLEVRLPDGSPVGHVREILRQGAQSLLVIAGDAGDVLVPMVPQICTRIEVEDGWMVIEPPEGLLELNRAKAPSRKD